MSLALVLGLGAMHAPAQSLRDPTLAPAIPEASAGTAGSPVSGLEGGMAIVVRETKPYLVLGTRLYAQGQMLGQARIERITETEVWLREAGQLRRLAVFSGIERRNLSAPAANKDCVPSAETQKKAVKVKKAAVKADQVSKSSTVTTPCAVAQP
jgi:hypothetical protein